MECRSSQSLTREYQERALQQPTCVSISEAVWAQKPLGLEPKFKENVEVEDLA